MKKFAAIFVVLFVLIPVASYAYNDGWEDVSAPAHKWYTPSISHSYLHVFKATPTPVPTLKPKPPKPTPKPTATPAKVDGLEVISSYSIQEGIYNNNKISDDGKYQVISITSSFDAFKPVLVYQPIPERRIGDTVWLEAFVAHTDAMLAGTVIHVEMTPGHIVKYLTIVERFTVYENSIDEKGNSLKEFAVRHLKGSDFKVTEYENGDRIRTIFWNGVNRTQYSKSGTGIWSDEKPW